MPSTKALARIEGMAWILIYGGLFTLVLGLATRTRDAVIGWSLVVAGAIVSMAGVVLIWVRSRLRQTD